MPRALIVDDDEAAAAGLAEWLEARRFETDVAGGVTAARERIDRGRYDLALLDLRLPDGTGIDVIAALGEQPDVEIVMVTGHGSIDSAVEALKLGATDYLTKPIDLARLEKILDKVLRTREMREQIDELRGELRRLGRFGCMIGASEPMQRVYDLIGRVAGTDSTVLVTGETGVGKELAARMVHELSGRSRRPFVPVNCGAIPPNLIESELFGHEKGSFTGADRRRTGVLERASGGTLFLDEVTEMPLELQPRLLRVLETERFQRVGGEREIEADLRVVAATNRDPREAVAEGRLREDLLYRLNVFPIELPPLRRRGDDVELLARHFLDALNANAGGGKQFTTPALDKLRAHDWPGNVRELRNVVERSFILAAERIEPVHVPLNTEAPRTGSGRVEIPLGTSLDRAERELILATLAQVGGNRRATAEILGISPKTLYNRLKRYGESDDADR